MTAPARRGSGDLDWSPRSIHTGALLRLRTIIDEEAGSRFVIAVFGDGVYRDRLIDHLASFVTRSRVIDIGTVNDFGTIEHELVSACASASIVHVVGTRTWLSDEQRAIDFLQGLNYRREPLAARCGSAVVLWVSEEAARRIARESPDFWAWRAASLNFVDGAGPSRRIGAGRIRPGYEDGVAKRERLAEIQDYLRQDSDRRSSHVLLLIELSEIEASLGRWKDAEKAALEARELAAGFDDRLHEAVAWGLVADIRVNTGDLAEALRIRRDEQLPVFERLGDARACAITMGRIADVLETRGDLEEGLRIRRDEQLPIFERLGDVHSRAVTMGRIADVLQARGETEEALRIRLEEELPIFEQLGDTRSRAIALQRIASGLLESDELTQVDAKTVLDALAESYALATKLDDPQGVEQVGLQLAGVLAETGKLDEAREILIGIESTLERLQGTEALSRIEDFRRRMETPPENDESRDRFRP